MAYFMGRVTVEDYANFRSTFDGAEAIRKDAGALGSNVYQSVDDPNEVIIEIEFPTVDAAKTWAASQELREVQQRAGLKGTPRTLVVNKT
jgi:heme-degrading monooxygenase HmoA